MNEYTIGEKVYSDLFGFGKVIKILPHKDREIYYYIVEFDSVKGEKISVGLFSDELKKVPQMIKE